MSPALNRRWAVGGLLVGFCAIVALVVSLGAGAGTTAVAAAPKNTSPPTITGTAQEGQKLVGHRGQWSGNPTDYNDFWVRCDKDGGSCANISGAHRPQRIRAQERRRRQHDPVQGAGEERGRQQHRRRRCRLPSSPLPRAAAAAGCERVRQDGRDGARRGRLAARASDDRPDADQPEHDQPTAPARSRPASTSPPAAARSKGRSSTSPPCRTACSRIPNEQPTGSDGWATLQFTALAGYPVSNKQQLLVMFVRARKTGEDLLGGISTRRLVSFHVSKG